jgi:MoaA/NifB/PqqE/SkfB family radical SAM enzyme
VNQLYKKVGKFTLLKIYFPYFWKVPLKFSIYAYKKFKYQNPQWFNNQIWITTLFPPYPSEAFNRFMDVTIKDERLPQAANFAVTSNCPFSCSFCGYGRRVKKDLKTKQIIDIINQLKDLKCSNLGITGGEPLLRDDLEEIITAAKPEIFTILFTSGYKLSFERVKSLKKAGLDCITFGLEYSDPKKQDEIRGHKESFKYIENAVKNCRKAGIFISIATIGTKEKIKNGELNRILQLAKKWNVGEIRLISPIATGRWTGCLDQMLGPEEYEQLRQFHINQNNTHTTPIITWITYYESPDLFGCLTGYRYVFIEASGDVCPCDQTPLSFGNVTKEPLKDIWKRMEKSFPRPRLYCLMNDISPKIDAEILPIPPEKSVNIVPKIEETTPLPEISKRLIKKRK